MHNRCSCNADGGGLLCSSLCSGVWKTALRLPYSSRKIRTSRTPLIQLNILENRLVESRDGSYRSLTIGQFELRRGWDPEKSSRDQCNAASGIGIPAIDFATNANKRVERWPF